MRLLCSIIDQSGNYDYGEFTMTADLAKTIMVARKKLQELKADPLFTAITPEVLIFDSRHLVHYFDGGYLGDPGCRTEDDPERMMDKLTEEQRAELEAGDNPVEISEDFLFYEPPPNLDLFVDTNADLLCVGEDAWWFESHYTGAHDSHYSINTLPFDFELLSRTI